MDEKVKKCYDKRINLVNSPGMRESFRGNPSMQEECELCGGQNGHHAPRCLKVTKSEESGIRPIPLDRIRSERGKVFERDLLGAIDVENPAYQAELKKILRPGRDGKPYGERRPLIDLMKRFQPSKDGQASSQFLEDLRLELSEMLQKDEENAIKTYTSVDTPLDVLHGIDAFISIDDEGKEQLITIDATLDRLKASMGAKADVIATDVPDANIDEDGYLSAVSRIAKKIHATLKERKDNTSRVFRSAE